MAVEEGKKVDGGVKKLSQFSKNDVLIALMGITGSGKSTFISLLSEDFVQIGHELSSCRFVSIISVNSHTEQFQALPMLRSILSSTRTLDEYI